MENEVTPARLQPPGVWPTPMGGADMAEATCRKCDSAFERHKMGARRTYCFQCLPLHSSQDGYLRDYKRLERDRKKAENNGRTCEECSEHFMQTTMGPRRRWCYECLPARPGTQFIEGRREVDRIRYTLAYPAVGKVCEACKIEFHDAKRPTRRWCYSCLPVVGQGLTGTEWVALRNELDPDYHAKRLDVVRASNHKRRAIMLGAEADDDITLSALLVRDDRVCHICRKKVHPTKTHPHAKAPTIDHIVPLSRGGTHTWANVAVAHFVCNTRKNNRAANDQLRLIG